MVAYVAVPNCDTPLTTRIANELLKYDSSVQIFSFSSTNQFSQIAPTDRLSLMILGTDVKINNCDVKAPKAVEILRSRSSGQMQVPIYVATSNETREYLGALQGIGANGILNTNGHFSEDLKGIFQKHLPR